MQSSEGLYELVKFLNQNTTSLGIFFKYFD